MWMKSPTQCFDPTGPSSVRKGLLQRLNSLQAKLQADVACRVTGFFLEHFVRVVVALSDACYFAFLLSESRLPAEMVPI